MPARPSNPNQYLKRIGNKWYVNVRVPPSLEKHLGSTHIRRTLKTGDLGVANRLKHSQVAQIKAELHRLLQEQRTGRPIAPGLTLADADQLRREMEAAIQEGHEGNQLALSSEIEERSRTVERLHGTDAANRFVKTATRTETPLQVMLDKWLEATDYKGVTKDAHKEALRGLLEFLRDEGATPSDVSRLGASDYLDNGLLTRGYAKETIQRKLRSLSAFWSWMEVKGLVAQGTNPWKGHRVSAKSNAGSRPQRRQYEEAELVQLFAGPGSKRGRGRPTDAHIRDLAVLGLFTGARLDELCNLRAEDLKRAGKGYVIQIRGSKTKSGIRPIAVVHAAPTAVLARRIAQAGKGRLFPELRPGGIDGKFSHEASKAFGRYRRACGIDDGVDFHSFRRQVATVLEQGDVSALRVDRFLGHKTNRLATDVYSAGASEAQALETARRIRYSPDVEAAALSAVRTQSKH